MLAVDMLHLHMNIYISTMFVSSVQIYIYSCILVYTKDLLCFAYSYMYICIYTHGFQQSRFHLCFYSQHSSITTNGCGHLLSIYLVTNVIANTYTSLIPLSYRPLMRLNIKTAVSVAFFLAWNLPHPSHIFLSSSAHTSPKLYQNSLISQ